jgi:hypothetical protein
MIKPLFSVLHPTRRVSPSEAFPHGWQDAFAEWLARAADLGDEGGTAVYAHQFRTTNENGRHVVVEIARYPDLIYRTLDQQFEFSGGSYVIRAEGIDK